MNKEKRRPTLEELRLLPRGLWELELAHIGVEAVEAGLWQIDAEASRLFTDPNLTPEMIVELRDLLKSATIGAEEQVLAMPA